MAVKGGEHTVKKIVKITLCLLLALILLIATAVIIFKHLENFKKIEKGQEIGLRSTLLGKNRVK